VSRKPKRPSRCDTDVFAAEIADDHCALGFTWAVQLGHDSISAILGPARRVVARAAAMIVEDVDRLGCAGDAFNAKSVAAIKIELLIG
jgi:hypothetical protein